jgi:sensor histidine kinase YesM
MSSVKLCDITIRRSRFEFLDHSIGKTVWKKSMSSHRQWYGRYIPTVSLTKLVLRYIPTESETKLFSSIKITDVKCPSVIPLVFADFLVVTFIIIITTTTTTTTTLFYLILNPEKNTYFTQSCRVSNTQCSFLGGEKRYISAKSLVLGVINTLPWFSSLQKQQFRGTLFCTILFLFYFLLFILCFCCVFNTNNYVLMNKFYRVSNTHSLLFLRYGRSAPS